MTLYQLLRECLSHLPINNSIIPFFIVAAVLHHEEKREELTLKNLYATLHFYSDVGIKNNLADLVRNNWLELSTSTTDKRVKKVSSTQKLRAAYGEITAMQVISN